MGGQHNIVEWTVCESDAEWQSCRSLEPAQPARHPRSVVSVYLVVLSLLIVAGSSAGYTARRGAGAETSAMFSETASPGEGDGHIGTSTHPDSVPHARSQPAAEYATFNLDGVDKALLRAVLNAKGQSDPISILNISYPQEDIAIVHVIVWLGGGVNWYRATRLYQHTPHGWIRLILEPEGFHPEPSIPYD